MLCRFVCLLSKSKFSRAYLVAIYKYASYICPSFMVPKIKNITIVFLAGLLFFATAGVTVVNFCCSDCLESQTSKNGHTMDGKHQSENMPTDCCCGHAGADNNKEDAMGTHVSKLADDCCSIVRLTTDVGNRADLAGLQNLVAGYFIHIIPSSFIFNQNKLSYNSVLSCRDVIPRLPREYLSLIRMLII